VFDKRKHLAAVKTKVDDACFSFGRVTGGQTDAVLESISDT